MTEFDRQFARKQYRDLLRKYHAKKKELEQLQMELAAAQVKAEIDDPLPWTYYENEPD